MLANLMPRKPRDPKQPEIADPDNLNTSLVNVKTQDQLFQDKLDELEDEIVTLFACGASVSIIKKRLPTFTEAEISEIIRNKLTLGKIPGDLLPGMQIYGFNDDLRVLSDLIKDNAIPYKEKLLAVKTRIDARNSLISFLQDQNLLVNPSNSLPEGHAPENGGYSPTKKKFEELKTPSERQRFIDCLARGIEYTPLPDNFHNLEPEES